MINVNKTILSIIFWVLFPVCIYSLLGHSSADTVRPTSVGLATLYIAFGWSMALLIFSIETSRQKLFKPIRPIRAGLRMGVYSTIAIILAYVASPDSVQSLNNAWVYALIFSFVYGSVTGYLYGLLSSRS